MIRFSTDELRPEDRFDHWREVRGKNLFGVTIELAREKRRDFEGFFTAQAVGGAIISEMRASAYRISRTQADIARISGNSLCIGLQVTGGGLLDIGRSDQLIRDGDMTINHSDLPYSGIPGGHRLFHYRMLKVPCDDDIMLGRPGHDLFASRLIANPGFARPFRALFTVLSQQPDRVSAPQALVTHITRLALLARGRLSSGMPEVRAALRAGLYHAALEIMERDKHHEGLTPAVVAAELGISPRQLHIVFESAELSFSRTLAGMRIAEAKRLLINSPTRPITQIAYDCGFDSLATFYRWFSTSCGMAPREFRELNYAL